jgi:MarR family transcriptional regulator, organic hydroperoxide resistance regulator
LPQPDREDLAGEAWRQLMGLMFRQRRFFVTTASSFGLNPGSLKALLDLDVDNPASMRALAEAWQCDASNVTWLVDQLESRGLVERRVSPTDRRVKTVVLTPTGRGLRDKVESHMRTAPPELLTLDGADLAVLVRVLRKIEPA